jgi:undecaprenyl pyrophosphate phosphatase UppP
MNYDQLVAITKRFARGFLSGGIGAAAALLAAGVSVTNAEDLKKFAIALVAAFVSGGLLAIDKLLRYEPEA